jgi:hypothetical protein
LEQVRQVRVLVFHLEGELQATHLLFLSRYGAEAGQVHLKLTVSATNPASHLRQARVLGFQNPGALHETQFPDAST